MKRGLKSNFTIFCLSLQHHCRNCGEIFCNSCSEQVAPLPNDQGQIGKKPVRVCDECWQIINAARITEN